MASVVKTTLTSSLIENSLNDSPLIEIESNLNTTPCTPQDPITIAIPPPLTPDDLVQSKQLAQQVLKQLPPDTDYLSLSPSLKQALVPKFDLSDTQKMLEQADFAVDWAKRLDADMLDSFVKQGFIVLDDLYQPTALLALQAESGFVEYRDAKLTEGVRKTDIRGDRIRWITKDFFAGFYYLNSINDLAFLFNRTLFAGIRHSEAHYACYPPGFGYKWHSDNPVGRDERVISAVFYLNDDWTLDDGGELSIIDSEGQTHQLMPKANRLVIFDSNLLHQVELAHRQRYSIATWLRCDDALLIAEPI
ncbi:2OG-Fe(II) oxygenase [Psychrobacter raelei]|uniref:2OG-Fe(II) oxygenase n=1 Tax=Psychrobacter raelei TaxID=2565531 RepID=UPI003F607B08